MSVVEAHRIDGSKEETDDGDDDDDDTSEIAAAATPRDVLADFGLLSAGETTGEEIDFDDLDSNAESVIGTSTG